MKGAIYSSERCPECGGVFKHDENRCGLFCPHHHDRTATKNFRVHFGRKIKKRFKTYQQAIRFLTGLRFKEDEGSLDSRDYAGSNPLAFSNLVPKYLKTKLDLKPRSYKNIERDLNKVIPVWGDRNVKTIRYADIEDWLIDSPLSGKTKSNFLSSLLGFFKWLKKREGIPIPEMPNVKVKMGFRQFTDLDHQAMIIEDVRRHEPMRVWLGVKWLATYIAIRPGEMRQLLEKDVGLNGCLVIRPDIDKNGLPKMVPMTEEDLGLRESLTRGLPDMPFFRHEKKVRGGVGKPGDMIGKNAMYRAWKRACKRCGLEGVDLYGGTKHTTATGLAEYFSPEEIMKHGTMHRTSEAFNRYFQAEVRPSRNLYEKVNEVRGNVIKLKKRA